MTVGEINAISGISIPSLQGTVQTKAADKTNSFDTFFNAYLNMVDETNTLQLQADQVQLDFAVGKTDDMLAVTLAQEKAYASLNFTVQVTNKLIDAYKEIMRMQI